MADPTGDVVQVSRQEWNLASRAYDLMNKLYGHKEHGETFRKGLKAIDPSLSMPEDVAEPIVAKVNEQIEAVTKQNTELAEKLAKLEQERTDERDLGNLQKALDKAQAKFRLTDEGMAEVRKIMGERNVADPEIAAQYVVANIEPAKPMVGTNFGPTDANVFGIDGKSEDESIKALHHDPLRWLDKAVPEIMQEFEQATA